MYHLSIAPVENTLFEPILQCVSRYTATRLVIIIIIIIAIIMSECCRQVGPAIDAALLKVNSRLVDRAEGHLTFPDFNLTVNYVDSMCDSAESLNHAIEFYMAGQVSHTICFLVIIIMVAASIPECVM